MHCRNMLEIRTRYAVKIVNKRPRNLLNKIQNVFINGKQVKTDKITQIFVCMTTKMTTKQLYSSVCVYGGILFVNYYCVCYHTVCHLWRRLHVTRDAVNRNSQLCLGIEVFFNSHCQCVGLLQICAITYEAICRYFPTLGSTCSRDVSGISRPIAAMLCGRKIMCLGWLQRLFAEGILGCDDTTRQNRYFFVDQLVVECVESWKQCCCPRGQIYKCLSLNVKVLVNFWGLLSSAMRHTYKMLIIYELAWCYHAAKIFFLHKIMIYTFFALLDTFSRTLVGAVHKNQETAFSASIESRTPNASDSSIS